MGWNEKVTSTDGLYSRGKYSETRVLVPASSEAIFAQAAAWRPFREAHRAIA